MTEERLRGITASRVEGGWIYETCRFVDDPPTFVDALILFKVTEFVSC
jgi:hypothetical protein